jgi:hypothetical protein
MLTSVQIKFHFEFGGTIILHYCRMHLIRIIRIVLFGQII